MKIPWTERTFDFSFPVEMAPIIIARLEGAPARVAWYVSRADQSTLTRRVGDSWSIQENIAHLADLDGALFHPRLDEFERGAESLMPADMSNALTWGADHNDLSIHDVLERFGTGRAEIIARLDAFDEGFFSRVAQHPRLGVSMRVVDLLFFWAEHDDHHAARIRELLFQASPD